MAQIIFHESYGNVTRPLLAAIRKWNVSPSDMDSLREAYGDDLAAIKSAIETYTFQGMFSVFEFWNRAPLCGHCDKAHSHNACPTVALLHR